MNPAMTPKATLTMIDGVRVVAPDSLNLITPYVLMEQQDWFLAATLEELERLCAFSSFYTGPSAKQRLELIQNLGLGSEEMHRRWDLVRKRFGGAGS